MAKRSGGLTCSPSNGVLALTTNGTSSGSAKRSPRRITRWATRKSSTQTPAAVTGASCVLRTPTVARVDASAAMNGHRRARISGTTASTFQPTAVLVSSAAVSARAATTAIRPVRLESSRRAAVKQLLHVLDEHELIVVANVRSCASRRQMIFDLTPEGDGAAKLTVRLQSKDSACARCGGAAGALPSIPWSCVVAVRSCSPRCRRCRVLAARGRLWGRGLAASRERRLLDHRSDEPATGASPPTPAACARTACPHSPTPTAADVIQKCPGRRPPGQSTRPGSTRPSNACGHLFPDGPGGSRADHPRRSGRLPQSRRLHAPARDSEFSRSDVPEQRRQVQHSVEHQPELSPGRSARCRFAGS